MPSGSDAQSLFLPFFPLLLICFGCLAFFGQISSCFQPPSQARSSVPPAEVAWQTAPFSSQLQCSWKTIQWVIISPNSDPPLQDKILFKLLVQGDWVGKKVSSIKTGTASISLLLYAQGSKGHFIKVVLTWGEEWMDRQTGIWKDRWVDGWMDDWTDGRKERMEEEGCRKVHREEN